MRDVEANKGSKKKGTWAFIGATTLVVTRLERYILDRSSPRCSRVSPMLLAYVEQVADGVFPSRIVLKVESRSFKKKLKVGSTPSVSNYNSF